MRPMGHGAWVREHITHSHSALFVLQVGIIDTGIDYTHPALGGGFGPKFKVAYGRDFVGDAFRPGGPPASPDNDPVSVNGT